uniref:Uncharacterized protein n=1 Tax=Clytia hemisphaerica TaxID=252671 RepID=A0A7M5UQG6_9CNID
MTETEDTAVMYNELSQFLRSNLFPSVDLPWRTSSKSTFVDHGIQSSGVDTNHFRQKDWLGKWHERDIHRLEVLKKSEQNYQERIKRANKRVELPPLLPSKTLSAVNLDKKKKISSDEKKNKDKLPPVTT